MSPKAPGTADGPGTHRASVDETDRGLLLGDGLFETIPLYRGVPFRLPAHLDRLRDGASHVGIPVPDGLDARVSGALEAWRRGSADDAVLAARAPSGPEAALRVTLTRGPGWGLAPPERPCPTLLVTIRARAPAPAADRGRAGLRAVLRGSINERALTANLKSVNYLERIEALRQAHAAGADEALLVNAAGRVIEGTASNLFWVRDGQLLSPGPEAGALAGITRAVVRELAGAIGIPVGDAAPLPPELHDASEVFLTSSLRELTAVTAFEGDPVGDGRPGPVLRRLEAAFRAATVAETAGY